jgi:hypothetical protein
MNSAIAFEKWWRDNQEELVKRINLYLETGDEKLKQDLLAWAHKAGEDAGKIFAKMSKNWEAN